ncbi:MAG TPA: exodeoxyribonuclease VII large subunit [Rhodanobacteraceae bacterium]|nr:exodeoxyribonuclease VII large subunit [Rhodanobacteraceae bacterium]
MTDTHAPRNVLTPSALNRLVRDLLGDALPLVWIEGELSNVSRPASGHLYFTLKDAQAQVRCAMFKPKSGWLPFRPADGMHVLLRARVGLYEPRGEFQLVVEQMEEAGEGALRREFERLKAQLLAEGLFADERKRALPAFARRIGVITSATGAAVRDVLSVLGRRFALAEVEVLPVPVQGREAPPAIVAMLERASRCARYDVLLLTRGGGSLEDLWAFNDEAVARAIHASAVPVVSAIGHEVDFSIADFVADLRAPTPSAAAELLVPEALALQRDLLQQRERLRGLVARRLQTASQRLDRVHARLLARHPRQRLAAWRQSLGEQGRQLQACMTRRLQRERANAAHVARALHAVSPLATLQRGYAILFDADGAVVRSAAAVAADAKLVARLADGSVSLRRIDEES